MRSGPGTASSLNLWAARLACPTAGNLSRLTSLLSVPGTTCKASRKRSFLYDCGSCASSVQSRLAILPLVLRLPARLGPGRLSDKLFASLPIFSQGGGDASQLVLPHRRQEGHSRWSPDFVKDFTMSEVT